MSAALDCVVIGAGVVGLACARALALAGREVTVLEAAERIGSGASSRNSEVIHAGIYYPPGSLRARLCRRGREQLYDYLKRRSVAHRQVGKLIVASHEDQRVLLRQLQRNAAANGVELSWLEARQVAEREPALSAVAALHSPHTGILDSHGLMLALQADLEAAGGQLLTRNPVRRLLLAGDDLAVRMDEGDWSCRTVINAAGPGATSILHASHGFPRAHCPTTYFAKGHYFALGGQAPFGQLIYPLPEAAGLGIHFTLDLAGRCRFGPDVCWVDTPEPSFDPDRLDDFLAAIRRYWPAVAAERLRPDYAGVRTKLSGPGQQPVDFRIDGPEVHAVPGLVNLLGIDSPGLTSCLAIADQVVARAS